MNRPYTREKFIKLVDQLRKTNENMRISTDVIVGYPGEDSEDF
jgi:tRNA A37 methylthiotransferase MiaB